jgi:tyrosinase
MASHQTPHSSPVTPRRGARRVSFPPHARLFSPASVEAAVLPSMTPAVTARKNAEALTAEEQAIFKNAVTQAIADGIYSQLVQIHADMTHDMHTMAGMPAGTLRFLPWHRVYVVKFEQAMRAFDSRFIVPYWRWMDATSIPSWMESFRPTGVVDRKGNPIPINRDPGGDPNFPHLPTTPTIQSTVFDKQDFPSFTIALEGFPNKAHNLVHSWFHGTMSVKSSAPADPMFWMLHAEIDRLWSIWSPNHAGQVPQLTGASAILDPWPEIVSEVLDTKIFPEYPYLYDRMEV